MCYEPYCKPVTPAHAVPLVAVFIPAVLACMRVFYGKASLDQRAWMLCAALLQPAALLIDHGHFQYNNISLGLAVRTPLWSCR